MSGRGRKALRNVRGALSEIWEWSETLLDVQEWLGVLPECPGVFGRPSRMTHSGRKSLRMPRSGQESLPDIQMWSVNPLICPGVVESPSRLSGSGERPSRMSGSC